MNKFVFSHLLAVSALLASVSAAAPAATCNLPDTPTARSQAKTNNKPVLILWHGSDWLYDDAAVCSSFTSLQGAGLPLILGQFDDKTGLPNEVREKILPTGGRFTLPLAILLTPDGTWMAEYPSATVRSAAALKAAVAADLEKLPQFAELAAKAQSSTGIEAAAAATAALHLMREEDAVRQNQLRDIINKQDPKDETGGRASYGMEHGAMYKEINQLLAGGEKGTKKGAERDFAAAVAYVTGVQNRVQDMPKGKQQQWLAGLGYIYKEQWLSCKDEAARLKAADCYRRCAAIDPDCEYGKGALKYVRYVSPDSFIEIKDHFYGNGDQTLGFEKDWHVDVNADMQGAGTYVFRLVPLQNGGMVTRNYRLVVDGKVIATANGIDAAKNTKEVEFTVPAIPAGAKAEVWLTAQCNDGWFGCAGKVEMKKK